MLLIRSLKDPVSARHMSIGNTKELINVSCIARSHQLASLQLDEQILSKSKNQFSIGSIRSRSTMSFNRNQLLRGGASVMNPWTTLPTSLHVSPSTSPTSSSSTLLPTSVSDPAVNSVLLPLSQQKQCQRTHSSCLENKLLHSSRNVQSKTFTDSRLFKRVYHNPLLVKPRVIYKTNLVHQVAGVGVSYSFHTGSVVYSDQQNVIESAANLGSETTVQSTFGVQGDQLPSMPIEVPFNELGLGSAYPSGMAQMFMEMLHIDLGMPWWQVIGATTLLLRTIIFPVMIIAQRNMAKLNNHQPEIQKLQVETQLASMRGETEKAVMFNKALQRYFRDHDVHPFKSLLPMMVQGVFFTSMFFALRGMTNVPVPSMATGGIHWFTDLTIADPTFMLPVLTSSTIYLQLYLGADGLDTATVPDFVKKLFYVMPIASLFVMVQFPAALNLYWLSNNIVSVIQASTFRRPLIRNKFGIEERIIWKPEDLPMTSYQEEIKREIARQRKEQEKTDLQKAKEAFKRKEEEKERREKLLQALREEDDRIKKERGK